MLEGRTGPFQEKNVWGAIVANPAYLCGKADYAGMAAQRLQEALPVDTFVWDQNFTTGLEAVDSQHQMLIETFNDLSEVLQHCNATGEDAGL